MRLYRSTPCEHGAMGVCSTSVPCGVVHYYVKTCGTDCTRCPGGVLTEVAVDYEAAAWALVEEKGVSSLPEITDISLGDLILAIDASLKQ